MNFRTFFFSLSMVLVASLGLVGQSFKGAVSDSLGRPLPSARIVWLLSAGGIGGGHYTDSLGRFSFTLKNQPESVRAVVTAPNFFSDTIQLQAGIPYSVVLAAKTLNAYELVVESFSTSLYTSKPQFIENIGSGELRRAACCNLSESFETNATVDVGFTDAVTGAKTIQLLGLDGRYVSITSEQLPSLRGLASAYGISYIPGPWMESIQISKGSGSVVNGFESMAGQI
ncbi:MAG: TonB-dependent receptor, partial [Bacteroidetes bacterium]|nr:TonB-dependent receptor [Bacteroidota bacterium]